ncbi:hypothetical protein IGI04_038577 [Brassica rapa subsp. trilocularis]|uniref:RING-type domain-containing protein n=2 Tax=Brassica TaxID=3705 RepID=A0ABQ7LKL9_BRACM|nr:hypothetical protein IGI04_038577 [Brassica rapa subsp. trilocularis]
MSFSCLWIRSENFWESILAFFVSWGEKFHILVGLQSKLICFLLDNLQLNRIECLSVDSVCEMLKERRVLPVSSNRDRVSPYPLRSCRSKKQKEAESSSPLDSESVSEWEDVRCVICMEPPHNAVLLQCSSFSKGCRAYMCDTSARHSNCFKQFRRNKNTSRCSVKTLTCPYCRGDVHGTVKSTSARRFMNARPRCCSMDKCGFSGSYSQLKTHLKAEHPGFTPPKVDPLEKRKWDDLERAEFIEMINARQRWESEQRSLYQLPHHHPLIDLNFDAFMHNLFIGVRGGQASDANTSMPRLEFNGTRWTP